MSQPPNTLGKKKPAKKVGKSQEARNAEKTLEQKTVKKAIDQFKDEESKRFAILSKNPSEEDLEQFVSDDDDRELFGELVKFIRANGELDSYLSYIKKLKKTGDEFDSYTILTLLQFIKSNKSKPLAERFDQSQIATFFGNLDRVLSDETEKFQKHASTFITNAEKIALDMKIKSLHARTEKSLEELPFERHPGKYGPIPNTKPDQYQEYDYQNVSKFWGDSQTQKNDGVRPPIWRPKNKQNSQNDTDVPKGAFWNGPDGSNDDEKYDEQKSYAKNPLVISLKELESGLNDEIKKSYLQAFGRNFS